MIQTNMSEIEKLALITNRFGATLAAFVNRNSAGWVIDTLSDTDETVGAAFIASEAHLTRLREAA